MKAIRALFLLAVVLGLVAVGAASMWLGRGVKLAIERFGPVLVGAPVTVGAVVLTPWSGRGSISNLVIGNPPGFKGPYSVRVGSVDIRIKLASLVTDEIVVESVIVREPEIFYELGPGGSNLARLQRNAEGKQGAPSAESGGKSLFIRRLSITGGQIGLAASAVGGSTVKVVLPPVQMDNLGGKGRSPSQAVSQALGALTNTAGRAVTGIGTKAISGAANEVLGRLGGLLKRKK
ncbi:MAG: hypothetical protein HY923_11120 [Elusimicrobia bacterium]|nr:hypothetical protein [Elusimicrobiota bacterium]